MEPTFSGALQIVGVDDFITPSQECIKPVKVQKNENIKNARIKVEVDGSYSEISEQGEKTLEKAFITLNDCLACSGCITSAESVLVTQQSAGEFFANVGSGKTVVISISPQSRASVAAHFNLDIVQTHKKLIALFKSLGAHYVFDTSFSRDISLIEARNEFIERYMTKQNLPVLNSSCPGWICYAEKTHDYILPYISTVKSPQQVMGTLVKNFLAKSLNITGDKIYHVSIMPCFDKKLEASRDDFFDASLQTRDVDLCLTSMEILQILAERKIDFLSLPVSDTIDPLYTNVRGKDEVFGTEGGSGGYLEHIFKFAAKTLYGVTVEKVEYKVGRNPDFKEAILEVNGEKVLHFLIAYGFRNIQNLVRKIKMGNCSYHYVEVMACPSGCINGGGQIRAEKKENAKNLIKQVDTIYHQQTPSIPEDNPTITELYKTQKIGSEEAKQLFHTQYHAREKANTNKLAIKW